MTRRAPPAQVLPSWAPLQNRAASTRIRRASTPLSPHYETYLSQPRMCSPSRQRLKPFTMDVPRSETQGERGAWQLAMYADWHQDLKCSSSTAGRTAAPRTPVKSPAYTRCSTNGLDDVAKGNIGADDRENTPHGYQPAPIGATNFHPEENVWPDRKYCPHSASQHGYSSEHIPNNSTVSATFPLSVVSVWNSTRMPSGKHSERASKWTQIG